MDLIRHPDLVDVTGRMQSTLTAAMQANQTAATVAYRRTRSLRDILFEIEDRQEAVRVATVAKLWKPALVVGVGRDHILLDADRGAVIIPIASIESIEPA